ncbi:MAG: hypothetical protein GQ558_03635 [Thermoplasmata archaeon]|nr:hypothetical protein [Thermoplasmata archaeon]
MSGPVNTSRTRQTLSLVVFLLIAISISGSVGADCEEELEATQKELAQVKEERDEYAQRLEDSTTIIIIVLGLLIISWLVFWVSSRRQQVVLMELQRRTGVTLDSPTKKERKRRRG